MPVFSQGKIVFLAAFSKAIFQNPCPKDIVYLSVHPYFYLPQNLLQLSQSIRGPYFYSIFLPSWVHLGVWFVYAHAHTDFCFPPNASPYYFSIFNSCQFPSLPQNNINQLGLVNHHLVYSCLKLYHSVGPSQSPTTFFTIAYCIVVNLTFASLIL